jgi:preprotein translocase subunit SecE
MEPRKRVWVGALELVAVIVVVLAIVALAVWFLFFAHDPLLRS